MKEERKLILIIAIAFITMAVIVFYGYRYDMRQRAIMERLHGKAYADSVSSNYLLNRYHLNAQ